MRRNVELVSRQSENSSKTQEGHQVTMTALDLYLYLTVATNLENLEYSGISLNM